LQSLVMPCGRIRNRSSWFDDQPAEEAFDGVDSPPKETFARQTTPGGQPMMKRNRRSWCAVLDDIELQENVEVHVYNAFEEAAKTTTPYKREEPTSRLYKRDQAVSDGALYIRLQSTRVEDLMFDLADIDADIDEEDEASEAAKEEVLPENKPVEPVRSESVHDIVANENGELELLPVGDQPQASKRKVSDLGQDEVVTVRVFRFLEDHSDERNPWEQGLHNVNSGSLLWLLVHMLPKMHSMSGAKYGKWFTVHTINVQAKHFGSAYHMFNEGNAGPAKTFGASSATQNLVTGQKLEKGYFWFGTPVEGSANAPSKDVSSQEHLEAMGWQHVRREGPFDGESFIEEWRKQGEAMDEVSLQRTLEEWML
jgi:hypothetical protein